MSRLRLRRVAAVIAAALALWILARHALPGAAGPVTDPAVVGAAHTPGTGDQYDLMLAHGWDRHEPEAFGAPVAGPVVDTRWQWSLPADANGGLPAADADGVALTFGHIAVALVDPDGSPRWVTEHHFVRDVAPALSPETVFAATDHGVVALDRATGAQRWATPRLVERAGSPVLADGPTGRLVVVTSWDGAVAAVDAADGAVRWTTAVPGASLGPAAAGGGVAAVGWEAGDRSGVTALDLATGEPVWTADLPPGGTSGPAADPRRGLVLVVAGDGTGRALDLVSGTERWRVPVGSGGSAEVPPWVGARTAVLAGVGTHRVVVDLDAAAVVERRPPVQIVIRGGPVAGDGWWALPTDDGRLLVDRAGGATTVLDPPGRVSALALRGPDLVLSTRGEAVNQVAALDPGGPGRR